VVSVERTKSGFKFQLLARHFYKAGALDMDQDSLKDLDQVIETIKNLGRDVQIEGHTDSIPPPSETKLDNWDLSALRASHVVRYMISKHRFPQSKLTAAGMGDTRPIAHNGTEEGRSLNRRLEIHVTYSPEETQMD
jgi:chemotaxis protein MotB